MKKNSCLKKRYWGYLCSKCEKEQAIENRLNIPLTFDEAVDLYNRSQDEITDEHWALGLCKKELGRN
ncbi:hypothetical protein [Spiroplasma citri]|uniref:hypothetical protein n=1 Tax=Spiroplasma citri TaxID=2133 RepID=UPI00148B161D|nr:hypothetical protein [Spiroplasma citri]QJU61359.1 hypothetical protein HHA36_02270 [Spiroplasma citri]